MFEYVSFSKFMQKNAAVTPLLTTSLEVFEAQTVDLKNTSDSEDKEDIFSE